jgi:hypothetical protein
MPTEATIEQRLAALEAAVRELQALVAPPARTPAPNWLEKVIGSISDHEAFQEALEYGRAYRHADRPADEPGEQS